MGMYPVAPYISKSSWGAADLDRVLPITNGVRGKMQNLNQWQDVSNLVP